MRASPCATALPRSTRASSRPPWPVLDFWRRKRALSPFERVRALGVELAPDVVFYGDPIVSLAESSRITVGSKVILASESERTALGVSRPCILRTLRPGATISIGAESGLSG